MSTQDTSYDLPPDSNVGDQNVERLLNTAYKPETPDVEFARRVREQMQQVAADQAGDRPRAGPARRSRPSRPVRWLAGLSTAAAVLLGLTLLDRQLHPNPGYFRDGDVVWVGDEPFLSAALVANNAGARSADPPASAPHDTPGDSAIWRVGDAGLTARPRAPAPADEPIAVGDTVETSAGERRRAALPDGSIVYMNQDTRLTLEAERRVSLVSGEVFVEVAPAAEAAADRDRFVVQTVDREITSLGTKFAVTATAAGTGVAVTQGKVRVSDIELPITAGQQLLPRGEVAAGGPPVVPLPRASHALEWTRELVAAAESPLVPASAHAGGALIAVDPNGQQARLSLRRYHVDVHVEDGFARTTIDQTYFNHMTWRLEGTFYFPLPPDASLSRLAMYVDGKLMEGGMAERDYARSVFESIVARQKDPALLEWVDGSTFKMRVFPLEGRQEKRIVLSYTQKLPTLYGNSQYRFPAGHSLDAVRDWSFHARVKAGDRLIWSCDSHELRATKDANDLLLDADAKEVKLDRDVVVRLTERSGMAQRPLTPDPSPQRGEGSSTLPLPLGERAGVRGARNGPESASGGRQPPDQPAHAGRSPGPAARWNSTTHDGQRYLMLRFRPDLPTQARRQRRDWIFLFESSGDRDPVLARVQVDVIRTLLENAEHDDTFAILTAGTQVRSFAKERLPATPQNVKAAVEHLEGVHLVGALDLGQALAAAEPFVNAAQNPHLVHVGSGVPVLGERQEDVLLKRVPAGARYVGVGVGKRWSRQFMKTAASRTGGYFTQINPDEEVRWRAFDLYSTLSAPRLLNASVVDDAERATFLPYNDSVADGEELCAIAHLSAADPLPASVTVSGMLDGQPFRRVLRVENIVDHSDYLPRTWAKLHIDRLLAEDAARHKDEIVALSKAMYVMSPFTSLLVLENEQMYVQYKVDRGRKDHWAMYPCPEQIAVVYEPQPSQLATGNWPAPAAPSGIPSTTQVLQSIVVGGRMAPASIWPPDGPDLDGYFPVDHYSLSQTYMSLLICPNDDSVRSGAGNLSYIANAGVVPLFDLDGDTLFLGNNIMGGEVPKKDLLLRRELRLFPGEVLDASATRRSEANLRKTQKFLRNYPLATAPKVHHLKTGKPVAELAVIADESKVNLDELVELKQIRNYRVLLSLIQADRSHIPFPDEPPIEYPDAEWWQRMLERRKNWAQVDLTGRSLAQESILQKLSLPVTLDFVDTPLSDVVDFLHDYTKVNIVLDKQSLQDEGITTDTPANIHVQGISLRSVLKLLLGQYNLTFLIKDDVLQITSQVQAGNELLYKVYPVADLVVPATDSFWFTAGVSGGFGRRRMPVEGTWANPDPTWAAVRLSDDLLPAADSTVGCFIDWNALQPRIGGGKSWNSPLQSWPVETLAYKSRSGIAEQSAAKAMSIHLSYGRPASPVDSLLFSDLLHYAPGLSTTLMDALAVVDAEAEHPQPTAVGRIDPEAQALLNEARSTGWQTLNVPARNGKAPFKLTFDGTGRYAYERTTVLGLRERVVCDGTTLWHLYPELGIGTRRTVGRFHRAQLAALVPWLLPPAEDLARGADLVRVADRTVAIVPKGASAGKDADGNPVAYRRTHLVFAPEGRLAERQLVEMPTGKVLLRETYSADGVVQLLDAEGAVVAEHKLTLEPAAAPQLAPDTRELVVLPLPIRTRDHVIGKLSQPDNGRFEGWSEQDSLALIAADLVQNPDELKQIVGQRFFARGDRRIGFYALLLSAGLRWDPKDEQTLANNVRVRFDPVADHPNSLLAKYVFLHQQQMAAGGTIGEMDLADGRTDGFVQRLAGFRDLYARWTSGKAMAGNDAQQVGERKRALDYLRTCQSPLLGWAVLSLVLDRGGDVQFYRDLVETWPLFDDVPVLSYAVRYETARGLLTSGDWQKAKQIFSQLHADTLKRGVLPPIEQSFYEAFQQGGGPAEWSKLMREAAGRMVDQGDRPAAIALAWQCHNAGDPALADELLAAALAGVSDDERIVTTLLGVGYLRQIGQPARAAEMLQPLLEDDLLGGLPFTWRLGSELAERSGMTARSVACLDRATDIEYQHLPEVVNLQGVRESYGTLLGRYQQLAAAIATLHDQPPQELLTRVVRAADRWRSLDSDDTAACQAAARVLRRLGARELAWDYLTTPLAQRPNEAAPWLNLAQTLRDQHESDLAARAYALAFEAEPTNAQILWDHAQMLQQSGRLDAARPLLRQLADGQWQPRFQTIQSQARKSVDLP